MTVDSLDLLKYLKASRNQRYLNSYNFCEAALCYKDTDKLFDFKLFVVHGFDCEPDSMIAWMSFIYTKLLESKRLAFTQELFAGLPTEAIPHNVNEHHIIDEAIREIIRCPNCDQRLRLPKGRSGIVVCPICKDKFWTKT